MESYKYISFPTQEEAREFWLNCLERGICASFTTDIGEKVTHLVCVYARETIMIKNGIKE